MSLLGYAVGRLLTEDGSEIKLDTERCVRARDKFSKCQACIQVCPPGALRLDHPVALDETACTRCGLCLHTCPVGAFEANDTVRDLWNAAAQASPGRLEIACAHHTALDSGPAEVDATIQSRGCLAALGPSAWIGLLALGHTPLLIRVDTCAGCKWGKAQPGILKTIAIARAILARGESSAIVEVDGPPNASWVPRGHAPNSPAVSRRSFFRALLNQGKQLAASAIPPATEPETRSGPPRERKRLQWALARLPAQDSATIPLTDGLAFAKLSVDEKCTACGICARVCPTGALQFTKDGDTYRITFKAADCTNCGICLDLCMPHALARQAELALVDLLDGEPRLLRTGALRVCPRCKIQFDGDSESGLCPICDLQQKHPLGIKAPPG